MTPTIDTGTSHDGMIEQLRAEMVGKMGNQVSEDMGTKRLGEQLNLPGATQPARLGRTETSDRGHCWDASGRVLQR